MNSIFNAVKSEISVPEAASYYGLTVPHSRKICCLFHQDHHPSLHLYDDHYYCYGCHACGDVIAFTAKLFSLSQYEAAKKLAIDFGLVPPPEGYVSSELSTDQLSETDEELEKRIHLLSDYERLLRDWKCQCAPVFPEDELYDWRFVLACRDLPWIEYMYDCISSIDESEREWADQELEVQHSYERMQMIISLGRKEDVLNGVDEQNAA